MRQRPPTLLPFALCLLPFAFLFAPPQQAQAAVISRSTEISMGREAAQEYERGESIDADPVLTARVRRIGQRLVAAGGATDYPFEFHSVETNGINAFAFPGGFIYIFRGLAQLAPGDDALAFILAHEISHVTRRHGIRQLEKSLALGTVLNFAFRGGMASTVLQFVIDAHYSRQDETEADRLGLEMMARAGFDPAQGAEAMAVIARAAKSGRSIPPFLRSHPLPESRIAALRRQANALRAAPRPERKVAAGPPLPDPTPPAPPASVTASQLFPLEVGMRWTYRVAGSPERLTFVTSVLEEQPRQPGVFRVRTELEDGLATTRLLAVTTAGVTVRPLPTALRPSASNSAPRTPHSSLPQVSAWQVEIPLPANVRLEGGDTGMESVRVPAGEFRALRAEQRLPGGEVATVWLAPGVGIVRREWQRTGLVEELESFHRSAPDRDQEEEKAREEEDTVSQD